jgi:hypothetical protein
MDLTEASGEELVRYLQPHHLQFLVQQKSFDPEIEDFLKNLTPSGRVRTLPMSSSLVCEESTVVPRGSN